MLTWGKEFVVEKPVLTGPDGTRLEAKLKPVPQDESAEDHFLEEAADILEDLIEKAGIMTQFYKHCDTDSYRWDSLQIDIPHILYAQRDVDIFEDKQWILTAEGTMQKC